MGHAKNRTRLGFVVVILTFVGSQAGATPPHDDLVVEEVMDHEEALESTFRPAGSTRSVITTRFRIPLRVTDWKTVAGYVDLDPTSGALDWDCQAETYDTHSGNDFAIGDFVAQAEGRFALAAASGTVYAAQDGNFDQQTEWISGAPANYIWVNHEDGSQTRYYHLKKWSTMVVAGQKVFEGQPLGLIGSSGVSTGAHLHFSINDGLAFFEPQDGPCQPGGLLWQEPQVHLSYQPTDLQHSGLSAVSVSAPSHKFRPPDVHHYQQTGATMQYYWARFRNLKPGDTSVLTVRDPSGSVYHEITRPHTALGGLVTWWPTPWALPATGSNGVWTLEHRLNGALVAQKTFTYDGTPDQAPEAQGRTVAVAHGTAGDALHGSDADGGVKEYRLVSLPTHGRVFFDGPRQGFFHYTPDGGFQGQDSFDFEVVDALDQASSAGTMTLDVSLVMANTLRLEGEDDHVAIPDNGSLNVSTAFTLEAWVRRTTGSAFREILFERRSGGFNNTGYSFGIDASGPVRLQVGDGASGFWIYGTTPIPLHRWTHLAATWDGQFLQVYVDGKPDATPVPFTGPISYGALPYDTWLGRSAATGDGFRGEIDEMRVWRVARSETELRGSDPCSFLAGPPTTLVGWWRMQDSALDSSVRGNHGTLVGAGVSFRSEEGTVPLCASEDTDADGLDDVADNCPLAPNAGQADADADGFGDTCDLCPNVTGSRRVDFDRDGVGDACDVCPFLADTDQLDSDGDLSGDLCDPDPSNAEAGVPVTPIQLALDHDSTAGLTTLTWTGDPVAEKYQVIRGSLEEIRARFYGPCVSANDPDPTDTTYVDGAGPLPGELFGYLVVGVGFNETQGLSGLDSEGRQRDMRAKDCL